MKRFFSRRLSLRFALVVLIVTFLFPVVGGAQGRGNGRGQFKKSSRFVNGHDARAGRWDGRGRRNRIIWVRRRHRRHRLWVLRHRRHRRARAILIR